VLSRLLPLADYGYFTLAVLVAGGVWVISGPVSLALMPRMARLEAEGDHAGLIRVYRQATQMVAVIAGAACATLAFCAEPLLWAWTGDAVLAHQAAPVLILYALGNGILSITAFPYYLQYAKGNLQLHLLGNTVFVMLLIPSIIWAAGKYGGSGAGYVWLIMNLVCFIFWLPFLHHKFVPGLHWKWYFQDVLMIFSAIVLAGFSLNSIFPQPVGRGWQMGLIIAFGLILLLVGACASTMVWEKAKNFRLV
jgi:O-antigen/teichoic acid export membrane protein